MKYSVLAALLGMVSSNGICFEDEATFVFACECHPSCGTACGYYDWPSASDDCIDCPAGSELNVVYDDGTGYCENAWDRDEYSSSMAAPPDDDDDEFEEGSYSTDDFLLKALEKSLNKLIKQERKML